MPVPALSTGAQEIPRHLLDSLGGQTAGMLTAFEGLVRWAGGFCSFPGKLEQSGALLIDLSFLLIHPNPASQL